MSERRPAPTVGQVVLGRRLRDLREARDLKRDDAARALHVTAATIRRMETAEVALKIPYVQMLLELYEVDEREIEAFVALAEEANLPGWWQRYHDVLPEWFSLYVSLEGAAEMIRSYEPHFVPGLLQTEEYARAVFDAGTVGRARPADIERHVSLRMARQSLLTREDAPHLWAVMDETVLRRPPGGPAVLRGQLDRLIEAAGMPHVTLQLAEFASGPHPATYGPFTLFRFPVRELPDMVFSEYVTGALYLDAREEVGMHLEVLDHLAAQAASAERTLELLTKLRAEL
ncbi:helix-turn-helix transcriptional regulator [Streptomyces sp. VRA16 Mangrove soil]|uniref:helix-turn-helix domain-containing protein n=1 Tax=Streptomyces sp. VRA16 Mangrove soil TaxID=2817434 RepID=UPI001A9F3071|nr:helix-turn-helix transcriptional regulator [Streptomyces sp. VRA16 Mangrove soil]MBO1331069.1 helix-turn-helix domain-containing protein [Streptomyces sp. VRA16 Mangrove soil]